MNVSLKLSAMVALTAIALTACGKDEPPQTPPGTYGANGQFGQPGQPGAPAPAG